MYSCLYKSSLEPLTLPEGGGLVRLAGPMEQGEAGEGSKEGRWLLAAQCSIDGAEGWA